MMTAAEVLNTAGNKVDVFLDKHLYMLGSQYLKKQLAKRFNLKIGGVNFIRAPVGQGSNFLERIIFLKSYDGLIYLTDGSIFLSTAKRNILHVQSPLAGQPAKSAWGKLKLKSWDLIIYNSKFTQDHAKKNWPLASQIIYPPVDTRKITPLKKRKYILSVGRFFGYLRDKKQQLLIKIFRELYQSGRIKGWSLSLAGSAQEGDKSYLEQLKKLASNLPVNFYPNIEYDQLVNLYGQSSIYWHASGFGEDDPTKMEHFGISTVEAMAGGCVPVVVGAGGQLEIVENGKSGFLWNSLDELEKATLKLVEKQELWKNFSTKARLRAKNFSKKKFAEKVKQIII